MSDYDTGYEVGVEHGAEHAREGWPTLYDIVKDERRCVTQDDVDKGLHCEAAIGFWRAWQTQIMQLALEIGQGKTSINEAEDRLRAWSLGPQSKGHDA